jgi:hypothetical protein
MSKNVEEVALTALSTLQRYNTAGDYQTFFKKKQRKYFGAVPRLSAIILVMNYIGGKRRGRGIPTLNFIQSYTKSIRYTQNIPHITRIQGYRILVDT